MNIRKVSLEDARQIAEIYNYYILETHHSFENEAVSVDDMMDRIDAITETCPFLVGEKTDEILAFAYAARYKPRSVYLHSVEVSIYVKKDVNHRGIGTKLYEKLLEKLDEMNVHAIIAGISLPNEASIKLHENFGFEKVAHFRELGFKFGRWVDVGYWEIIRESKNEKLEDKS